MKSKVIPGLVLTLFLIGMLTLAFNIQPVKASGTIYIRADGSIDPPTANITSADNITYTFTDNNYEQIVIERDNIVVDGAGYTLQGTGSGTGIDLSGRTNVTVQNTQIKTFYCGIRLDFSCSNNSIIGNNITANNWYGIGLYRSLNNSIIGNNIANNGAGIYLYSSSNNSIYHNNFIDNTRQIYDPSWDFPEYSSPSINVWDDGYPSGGNYWSDYISVDVKSGPNQDQPGSDGIGDTSYIIDAYNRDRYPLMYPWGAPPPPSYTLAIFSSPSGVTFIVDGVSRETPWLETYSAGASVSLVMPEIYYVRYYWNQWSDGVTTPSRTVTMNTNITLTALYTGPYYQLTVTSSPITGITFTINGTPKTTPYTEWLLEGSYTLVMPQTHNGYVWSHWQEDGDTNRIKTITLQGTTWTAVYVPAPSPPVGGVIVSMSKPPLLAPWIFLAVSVAVAAVSVAVYRRKYRGF